MKTPRVKFEVSYRVLDASGHCVDVIKENGYNKNNIKWKVERKVKRLYGKGLQIHQFKIEEIV